MRVVAGSAGGRRLKGPATDATRPMTDRTREAVFNSLHSLGRVIGESVVDLFAGTGALGIEALSRGASSVVFVDRDRKAIEVIRENLATTGFSADVRNADVLSFIRTPHQYDLAFVAPPYVFDDWDPILQTLNAGFAVLESDRSLEIPHRWTVVRHKKYGKTEITMVATQ